MRSNWLPKVTLGFAIALVGAVTLVAHHTGPLVSPQTVAGNFTAVDDLAICEAIMGADATQEMVGFKVDPPANSSDDYVSFVLSADGKYLSWEVDNGARMIAVVVKGGPNYNLYKYFGTAFADADHDNNLRSPQSGRNVPQISHYNVCYLPPIMEDGQGCTPGYWRNHADRWVGVAPSADFDATFGVDLFTPNVTLGWAIWAQGGGYNALARHATAALLNAYAKELGSGGQFVNFPYSSSEVIQMVQDAVADGTTESLKDLLASLNEAGCPLSGTPADPVR